MSKFTTDELYIAALKTAVETRFGKVPSYASDFDALACCVAEECSDSLSVSTLKRIWGYIEGWRVPRISTLDLLSQYAGYADFRYFIKRYNAGHKEQSRFAVSENALSVAALDPGDMLELSWSPGRKVTLRYEGDFSFKVTANETSKLSVDAIVRFTSLMQGQPMYADVQLPGSDAPSAYIAGVGSGINFKKL